jgi:hypothetical protein
MCLCTKLVGLARFISSHFGRGPRLFRAVFFVTLAGRLLRQPPKSIRFSECSFLLPREAPLGYAFGPSLNVIALAVHRYGLLSSMVAAA